MPPYLKWLDEESNSDLPGFNRALSPRLSYPTADRGIRSRTRAVWARVLPKHFTPTSGTGGLRTRDLRVASTALFRLSYGPRRTGQGGWTRTSDLARPKRVLSTTELHPETW